MNNNKIDKELKVLRSGVETLEENHKMDDTREQLPDEEKRTYDLLMNMHGRVDIRKEDGKLSLWHSDCPHCAFVEKTFPPVGEITGREYWIMTEVFVYLHGSDTCGQSGITGATKGAKR